MKTLIRILFAGLAFAALVESVAIYSNDRQARDPALAYLGRFDVQERRPDVARTVGFAPSADWTADILADAALSDAYSSVDLSKATPRVRQAWIDSVSHLDTELHATRDLLLDAIQRRPGWPFHQSLLGEVVLAADFRNPEPQLARRFPLWSRPLLNAAEAAPAVTAIWQSLAAAYVHAWPELRDEQSNAGTVFRNAFSDPGFVQLMFPSTAEVIGSQRALGYIPESPQPLQVAFDFFAGRNEVPAAAELHERWERAERTARAYDLAQIERHVARGDVRETRDLCLQWLAKHSVWTFDDAAAHAEAQRILEVWPGGTEGRWASDPIADVVRYLVSRNGDFVAKPDIILRSMERFSDVPPVAMAEAKLAAGDVNGADQLARSADDAGSLEWSGFLLQLARYQIRSKNIANAAATLKRLPAAAANTHEALLLQADIGSTADAHDPQTGVSCDPASQFLLRGARQPQTIQVEFTSDQPALVDIGLNDARNVTLLIDRERTVSGRLVGYRAGTFWYKRVAGAGALCARLSANQ